MESFERFTTKTHFISLKRQVVLAAIAMLAVKLVVAALGAARGASWLDLLARLPPSVADLGAALLVFEVLRAPSGGPTARPARPSWSRPARSCSSPPGSTATRWGSRCACRGRATPGTSPSRRFVTLPK